MRSACRFLLRVRLLAIVVLSITAVLAQSSAPAPRSNQAPLIQNVFHRQITSLNGDWHVIIDPYDTGVRRRYYQNVKPTPDKLQEYDFSTAPTLHVPGDWNTQRPELIYYEGTVWYENSFTYHPSPASSTFLYVGAANYRAHVWVNGESLCEHEGGFTPFNCDATGLLKDGNNFVVIS